MWVCDTVEFAALAAVEKATVPQTDFLQVVDLLDLKLFSKYRRYSAEEGLPEWSYPAMKYWIGRRLPLA